MPTLQLHLADHGALEVVIDTLVVAGWTGRDAAAVEHHMAELEAIGVKRPSTVPCFYHLGAALLTTETTIDVIGTDSSGEAEFVLLSTPRGLLVGVGSDHTDRTVEAYGVTVSKQICPKPIAAQVWRWADVETHWDRLALRCWRTRHDQRALYQEGSVTRMLGPRELITRYRGKAGDLPVGTAMFCGTQPVIGELGHGDAFEVELYDPVRDRRLRHNYAVHALRIQE